MLCFTLICAVQGKGNKIDDNQIYNSSNLHHTSLLKLPLIPHLLMAPVYLGYAIKTRVDHPLVYLHLIEGIA